MRKLFLSATATLIVAAGLNLGGVVPGTDALAQSRAGGMATGPLRAPFVAPDSRAGASQAGPDACAPDDAAQPTMPRTLARPIVCTFTTPRGSFGPTTPPEPAKPPVVIGTNETGTPPGTTPPGTPNVPAPPTGGFAYYPPGELLAQDKGRGRTGDRKVYLPGIVFPVKLQPGVERTPPGKHAFMNSQIWGYGGNGYGNNKNSGRAGLSECDPRNYDPMMQRDNFCEIRDHDMPMCPSGIGHQGQDIRPPACQDNKWDVVAVVDGIILQVTDFTTVRLKGGDGTEYWYLHMHRDSIKVEEGQKVKQGDVVGRVSNWMDHHPSTTWHLHLQIKQSITINGDVQRVYVPVYASLIAAYRRAKGVDPGIDAKGNLIADAAYEVGAKHPDAPDKPPFTLWPVINVAGNDGRPIALIDLTPAFRPADEKAKVSFAVTGLPPALSLDAATGRISGNLDRRASRGGANSDGIYTVTATATSTGVKTGTASQSFTITAKPSVPIVTAATTSKTFREGDPVLIAAGSAFSDPNLDTLSFAASGLPNGLKIDTATGRISGTLAANSSAGAPGGIFPITVTASDSQDGSVTESFTITVQPQKQPGPPEVIPAVPAPLIVAPLAQVNAFAGREIPVIDAARVFKPGEGDTGALQYAATGLPAGLAMDAVTGQIKGVLPLSAADGTGDYPIVVTASNSAGGKTSLSFLLAVRHEGPKVVAQTVNKTYVEGEKVLISAGSAFSAPANAVLTFVATGLPAGVAIDPKLGTITGTLPPGSAQAGANGIYTVRVVAEDERGDQASETFTMAVALPPPPPEPPQVTRAIAPLTVKDGDDFTGLDVKPNFKPAGTPGNNGPLAYSATGLPDALKLDANTGIISGKIAANASQTAPGGQYLVTLFAKDASNGLTTTLGFVITAQASQAVVTPPVTPPVVTPPVTPPVTPAVTPPVEPPKPPVTPPAPDASAQGWWPWIKDKVSGAWGWFGSK